MSISLLIRRPQFWNNFPSKNFPFLIPFVHNIPHFYSVFRFSSSRAFGHIGQQLGVILNGQLPHIQPPLTWSRPSANPAGKFCASSSWGVLFYACHPLESRTLPLSPLDNLVSVTSDTESAFCCNVWQLSGVGPEQDFLVSTVLFTNEEILLWANSRKLSNTEIIPNFYHFSELKQTFFVPLSFSATTTLSNSIGQRGFVLSKFYLLSSTKEASSRWIPIWYRAENKRSK